MKFSFRQLKIMLLRRFYNKSEARLLKPIGVSEALI